MKVTLEMHPDDLKMLRAILKVRQDRELYASNRDIMQKAVDQLDVQLYPPTFKHFCTRGNHTWELTAVQDAGPYDLMCPVHEQEELEEQEMLPASLDETEAPK